MKILLAFGVILLIGTPAYAVTARMVLEQTEILQGMAAVGFIELTDLLDDQLCFDFKWTAGQAGFRIRNGRDTQEIACKSLRGCDEVDYTFVHCLAGGTVRIPIFIWICQGRYVFDDPGVYSIEFWMNHRKLTATCGGTINVKECETFEEIQEVLESSRYPLPSMFLAFLPIGLNLEDFLVVREGSEYRNFVVEDLAFYMQRVEFAKNILHAADTGETRELPENWEKDQLMHDYATIKNMRSDILEDFATGLSIYAGATREADRPYKYFLLR